MACKLQNVVYLQLGGAVDAWLKVSSSEATTVGLRVELAMEIKSEETTRDEGRGGGKLDGRGNVDLADEKSVGRGDVGLAEGGLYW